MSRHGETITFCTTSLGRNHFLQGPTGLFGGDPSWGIGTYAPVSEHYHDSPAYRATVATDDSNYQRAATSCWYAMGQGVVRSLTVDATTGVARLTMAWSIADGLWTSVRVPGTGPPRLRVGAADRAHSA